MRSPLASLARPEHTGERRCWPCTVANGALLVAACLALALAGRPLLAAVVGVVGGALVAIRGYLVPYTPRFAPAVVRRVRAALGRPPREPPLASSFAPEGGDGAGDGDGERVLEALIAAGVVVPAGDDLALSPPIRERWEDEMAALAELNDDALAAAADAVVGEGRTATPVSVDGRRYVAVHAPTDAPARGAWLPRPAATADVAAVRALSAVARLDDAARLSAARAFRLFLDTCPTCGDPVVETSSASCCGGVTNPREGPQSVLACRACDAHLIAL
ncbi:hypothetical protein ACFQPA_12695 [Halomarina halobia]|uniref:Uncharacterized protein n=1 Tax=Halomarina halobia TaxID=3033386 RepID=A0ABD6A9H9_9EURY|nr:hypothetical protein [Halomarina sp. PSR21]